MLILSQDKKSIYNFNNIISIQIEEGYNGFKLIVYGAITDYTSLGKYKTEERAKEVLEEIICKYAEYAEISSLSSGISGIFELHKIYRMPEK